MAAALAAEGLQGLQGLESYKYRDNERIKQFLKVGRGDALLSKTGSKEGFSQCIVQWQQRPHKTLGTGRFAGSNALLMVCSA